MVTLDGQESLKNWNWVHWSLCICQWEHSWLNLVGKTGGKEIEPITSLPPCGVCSVSHPLPHGGFSHSSGGKESTRNAGDPGSIPGLGRSPGEGKGYPLQYSGLENSMDCIVHGVAKSWTRLSNFHFHHPHGGKYPHTWPSLPHTRVAYLALLHCLPVTLLPICLLPKSCLSFRWQFKCRFLWQALLDSYILSYTFLPIIYHKCESESRSVVSDPLWTHGLYNPGNSPGQNMGVGSLSLLQWVFPAQG